MMFFFCKTESYWHHFSLRSSQIWYLPFLASKLKNCGDLPRIALNHNQIFGGVAMALHDIFIPLIISALLAQNFIYSSIFAINT
jgi:hypothetical protein